MPGWKDSEADTEATRRWVGSTVPLPLDTSSVKDSTASVGMYSGARRSTDMGGCPAADTSSSRSMMGSPSGVKHGPGVPTPGSPSQFATSENPVPEPDTERETHDHANESTPGASSGS